jgi:signal transduction histidine kinase
MRLVFIRRHAQQEARDTDARVALEAERILHHFKRLIDTLLDVARLDQGIFGLNLEPTDVSALVLQTSEMLTMEGLPISVQVPLGIQAVVDPIRFQMALSNLISNALQHAEGNQAVEVRMQVVEHEGTPWAFTHVRDTGPGIEAQLLPHLFERYTAGHGSVGLGLGLYVTKQIIEAHGGTLTVASKPGAGTTFTFAVPITTA